MEFLFIGNNRALDFVNTEKMQEGVRTDLLTAPADLARWLTEAGIGVEVAAVVPEGAEGERVLGEARRLRTALREMAGEMAAGRAAPATALAAINEVLRRRAIFAHIERSEAGYVRREVVADTADVVGVVLAPVAEAAVELLITGEASRIHKCESERCILFFYDTSKNQTRRWCRMEGCGNRAKAAAHYARIRHGDSAEG